MLKILDRRTVMGRIKVAVPIASADCQNANNHIEKN